MHPLRICSSSAFVVGFLGVLLIPFAWADEVLVITDSLHPVETSRDVRVIQLDGPQHIKARLSQNLPTDAAQSAALAKQRLQKGGATLQQEFMKAYQGVVDAWSLGITKIPAVVVDQCYVVYGEPDVSKAVALIEAYRRSQP